MFLSKISLKNPVFITMLTIALMAFGLVSVKTLGVDQFPEMDIPFATVSVIYPGADSEKVEDEIITTIEDVVGTISGIDEIQSFSVDNAGFIVIRFSENVDSATAVQDVRDKISTVKKELPDDAEEPVVEKFDMNTESIISLILKTPSGADKAETNDKADTLVKTPLQSIEGVGRVNMIGGREREIKILLNPLETGQYNISAMTFFKIVASSMQEIPAGTIKMLDDNEEIGVSSDGKVSSVGEILNLPLFKAGGNTVKLSDVAVVLPGLEKEKSAAFRNISPAIAFEIIKQGDANVLKVANRIKEQLPEIEKNLPDGYSIEIAIDKTPFIENAVSGTIENIFAGALLAMLIIFLFLMNKRAALIVAVSLPTSIIGTFLFVKIMGFTLNMVTTLALSLCVGILTDDAIVVIETIFRHIKKGKGKIKACTDATKEVGLAVISSELALISVFGPITLISGLTGAIFKEFGITIVFAIIISVLVSFTVSPLLASVILKKENKKNIIFRIFGMFVKKLERRYSRAVGWSLNHRTVVLSAALLIFLLSLFLVPKIPTTFIPEMDMGRFTITMELPPESSLDRSKEVTEKTVDLLNDFEWSDFIFTTIGAGDMNEKHKINMVAIMKDRSNRKVSQQEAMIQTREKIAPVLQKYKARVSIAESMGDRGEAELQFNIVGQDFDTLRKSASMITNFMKTQDGYVDVFSTDQGFRKQVSIRFDHEKMSDFGVNTAESAMIIRYLLNGEKITEIKKPDSENHDVFLYLDPAYRNFDNLKNIPLEGKNGIITLGNVAEIGYSSTPVKIERFNRARKIGIQSGLEKGHSLGEQMDKIMNFAEKNLPDGVSIKKTGDAMLMEESFTDMTYAIIVAVFLIYIVLASQFNSFIHPFTIMTALPFAVTGAIMTLYLTGEAFSMLSFIAFILLLGIVSKNSILLVDYTLQLMQKGKTVKNALVESARVRLKPILMTAGGTLFGQIPIVLSTAEGAEIKHSMGYAIMGGLVFSTFVTLFIVPVMFSYMNKLTVKRSPKQIEKLKNL